MKSHFQVLVIGGGNAGISVAAQLLRKDSSLDIGIVDPSEKHYYQPAWTLVGAGTFDVNKTIKSQKDFIPKGAQWVKDAVTTLDPENNAVTCQSGQNYTYDVMVLCPGIQLDWDKIKGLKETLGKNNVSSNYTVKTAPYT